MCSTFKLNARNYYWEIFKALIRKKKSVCVIHEVEVDMIKKDNLSLYHYNVFLSCFSYFYLL